MGISWRTAWMSSDFTDVTSNETVSSTKSVMQSIAVSKRQAVGISLYIWKTAAPDTTSALIELFLATSWTVEWQTTLVPTGSALASCTIPSWSLSTTKAWVSADFSAAYTTNPALRYIIKVTWVWAQNLIIWSWDDGIKKWIYWTEWLILIGGTTTLANKDFCYKLHNDSVTSEVTSKAYLTSSIKEELTEIVWVVQSTVSKWWVANIEPQIATSFTWLDPYPYYLDTEAGKINVDTDYLFFKIKALTPVSTTSGIIIRSKEPSWDQDLSSYVTKVWTETITNKRITKRVWSTTSSATPTINTDNYDMYIITAQAVDITSFTTNLSWTPTEWQWLWIAITGTAWRAITWWSSFEASTVALPITTISTTRLDVWFVWNSVTDKWRCIANS